MNTVRPVLSVLIMLLLGSAMVHAQNASASQLEKAGKLKDAAEAYQKEVLAAQGNQALALIGRMVDADPDLGHLIGLLGAVGTNHAEAVVRSRAYYEQALVHLSMGALDEGRASCILAVRQSPDNWNARYLGTAIGLYLGAGESVRRELDEAFRANPPQDFFERFLALSAVWLIHDGRESQALALLEQQALGRPEASVETMTLGLQLYLRASRQDDASRLLSRMNKSYPGSRYAELFRSQDAIMLDPIHVILGSRLGGSSLVMEQKTAPARPKDRTVIQLGLYSKEANARAFADKFRQAFPEYPPSVVQDKERFRIEISVASTADAESLLLSLKEKGYEGFVIE